MWYPNRAQWIVIWLAAISALAGWIIGAIDTSNPLPGRISLACLAIGALLVWQLGWRKEQPSIEDVARIDSRPTPMNGLGGRNFRWILALLLIIAMFALLFVASEASHRNFSTQFFYVLGASLWLLIIAFLIHRKTRTSDHIALTYCVLTLAYTAYHAGELFTEAKQAKNAMQAAQTILNAYWAGKEIKSQTFDDSTYGEMAPALVMLNRNYIEFREMGVVLESKFVEFGPPAALNIENLRTPHGIEKSRKMLVQYQDYLKGEKTKLETRTKSIEDEILSLKMGESTKESFLKGYRSTQQLALKYWQEYYDIHITGTMKTDECLSILTNSHGSYTITASEIVFRSPATQARYRNCVSEIEGAFKRADALVEASRHQAEERLEMAETLTH